VIEKRGLKKVKLASDISGHPYTGWRADGHVLCESNSIQACITHGAQFIRINSTQHVREMDGGELRAVNADYVNPCLACGSMNHKTYSKKCSKKFDGIPTSRG
jgi:hypothetical protein